MRAIPPLAKAQAKLRAQARELAQQPFDRLLLSISPLYRRSRKLFLESGGQFEARFISSARTLSSSSLLGMSIDYNPVASELIWNTTDPVQKRSPENLTELRPWCTSLFHEQNHRTIWKWLPPPEESQKSVRRYLNLAESLVVALDMALGDELGPKHAGTFHLLGVTYDPGTPIKNLRLSRRQYRNYLQAALHATYLNLEHFDSDSVRQITQVLHPELGDLAVRAADRALLLDRQFVERTNPIWQARYAAQAPRLLRKLALKGAKSLLLPEYPLDRSRSYLIAEAILAKMGL